MLAQLVVVVSVTSLVMVIPGPDIIRESLTRSHRTVSRVFGGVLILLGVRVAIAEP